MNHLIVKYVPFCESNLLAVQEKETGKIYAGINSVLRELGFDEKQIEYRRDKWVTDKVLSKGTRKFSGTLLGLNTGKDTWCMDIKKLPIALAKIEITPKMENDMPDLSDKLEQYQERCADVLADAFLPHENELNIPKDYPSALRLAADEYEKRMIAEKKNKELELKIEQDKPKTIFADAVSVSNTSILIGELAKILKQNGVNIGQNRLFEWMRQNGYLISRKGTDYNMPTQKSMELGLFEIKERTINNPDGSVRITKTVLVTGKGQQYFINKFLSNTECPI